MGFLWIFLSFVLYQGTSAVDPDRVSVSVNDGDSVTLNTGVIKNLQDTFKWYVKDTLIAKINGDLRKSCTDVQCNEANERFRDRLKLDHQTGSLTIMNTRNTDSGVYELMITSDGSNTEKIFSVSVHGVSAAERDEVKRNQGENVTLDSGKIRKPKDVMTWYFNDTLIAEITGDPSKICTDDQCEERFRDRLKLDHQTGSLTIMNTTNTDSGEYKLKINSSNISSRRRRRSISFSISSEKIFHVSVTGSGPDSSPGSGSGPSPGAVAGIVVVVVLMVFVAAALGVIYYRRRISRKKISSDSDDSVQIPVLLK